jgi:hypothetical protein
MDTSMRNILIGTVLVIVFAAGGVLVFILKHGALEAELGAEVFKLTYQFLLLGVIGAAVSLLFTEFTKAKEQKRAKREEERILQRKFNADLIQAYNVAKSIRRLLRAKARTISHDKSGSEVTMIRFEPYDKQMQTLIDIQLQFETLKEEAENHPSLLSAVDGLTTKLTNIESYLNDIVGEYEDCYKSFPDNGLKPLPELLKLQEFIGPYKLANGFKEKFKKPAHEVMEGLLKLLTSEA